MRSSDGTPSDVHNAPWWGDHKRIDTLIRPASITSSMETRTWRWGLLILSPVMIAVAVFSFLQYTVRDPRPEALGVLAVLGMVIGIASIAAALTTPDVQHVQHVQHKRDVHSGP